MKNYLRRIIAVSMTLIVLLLVTGGAWQSVSATTEATTRAPRSPAGQYEPRSLLSMAGDLWAIGTQSVFGGSGCESAGAPGASSQDPTVTAWATTYGGSADDWAQDLAPTSDGGYIAAGWTSSFGASQDAWVLKLDGSGNVQWQKTYGGGAGDIANYIAPTSDGGYIVAGLTSSFGAGSSDAWVLKLDGSGNVQWQKTYGGSAGEQGNSIVPTSDGGYVLTGFTASFGAGGYDAWVLKLDGSGNVQWQKTYGGSGTDEVGPIRPTNDGGYIVIGVTNSFGAGGYDAWVLKLDGSGNVQGQKTYGGSANDDAYSIVPASDGGYVVAGYTKSFGAGGAEAWVFKLDGSGNVVWQKTYGGSADEYANSIARTSDGGYVVAGSTASFGGGNGDILGFKLDSSGNLLAKATYGGGNADVANFVKQTSDGGFILAGATQSFGGGGNDAWVLKLNAQGKIGTTSCGLLHAALLSTTNSTSGSPPASATVTNTSVLGTDSSASVSDSNAQINTQCRQ